MPYVSPPRELRRKRAGAGRKERKVANGKRKVKRWPTRMQVRGGNVWVPHPSKDGWEINVMDMTERKIKKGGKKK